MGLIANESKISKPRPPVNTHPKPNLKERLGALVNLPRLFNFVLENNHWYAILDAVLRLIRSASPVSILYVVKLIIDEVILLSKAHGSDHTYLWELVAAEFILAIISDALSRATSMLDSLLGVLFSNYTSCKIMEHAATFDLDLFDV